MTDLRPGDVAAARLAEAEQVGADAESARC
jgi:hypothetical protein